MEKKTVASTDRFSIDLASLDQFVNKQVRQSPAYFLSVLPLFLFSDSVFTGCCLCLLVPSLPMNDLATMEFIV